MKLESVEDLSYLCFDFLSSPLETCDLVMCFLFRCDMDEKKDEEDSTLNEGEAAVALRHAKRLVESGLNPSDIGIITPYAAQVFVISSFIFLVNHFICKLMGEVSNYFSCS